MGFLSVLKKLKQKEREVRILILGLDNAGKTTLLKRLNGDDIHTISPTFGFNIKTIPFKGFNLNLWDVGGQKSLRSYWKNYFECTDGIIWVVDSVDKRRLDDCYKELSQLVVEERLMGCSLLILANKQDLPGALSLEEIRDALQLEKFESHHWKIVSVSAFTGQNLTLAIDWLVSDIAARVFTLD